MKVGLVLQTDEDVDVGRRPAPFGVLRDLALQVEAAGFDSIWLYDHLLYRFEGRPSQGTWECWTILSALAAITERVELGTLVSCTGYRNPGLIAKMASTVDEISGGRLILGLGAGWHQPEYEAFGYPFDHRVDRFEEALRIIVPLLREGHVDFSGTYYRAPNCDLLPRGPRPQGPPLLIGGLGPRILRLTARFADSWNIGFHTPPEAIIPRMEAACAEMGRDPSTLEITLLRIVAYPELVPLPSDFPPYVTGTAEAIAAELGRYEQLGVGHVMLECTPTTPDTLQRLSAALERYRQGAGGVQG
ncbi:MAG TPA: LLM class flavin-dependent oxidoreductase [Chloroflexota bacterium]|nr:LLM class flavin-dependent oxidoreductase [Chloroflexota bacterium]